MNDIETKAATPDIVVGGVRLAWRDGDDWLVQMPQSASRAQVMAVNRVLGAKRFWRNGCIWLDGHHFSEVVRLQVAPQAEVSKSVAVAA